MEKRPTVLLAIRTVLVPLLFDEIPQGPRVPFGGGLVCETYVLAVRSARDESTVAATEHSP
jgi:hypothetical protein